MLLMHAARGNDVQGGLAHQYSICGGPEHLPAGKWPGCVQQGSRAACSGAPFSDARMAKRARHAAEGESGAVPARPAAAGRPGGAGGWPLPRGGSGAGDPQHAAAWLQLVRPRPCLDCPI